MKALSSQKRKYSRSVIVGIVLAAVIASLGISYYFYIQNNQNDKTIGSGRSDEIKNNAPKINKDKDGNNTTSNGLPADSSVKTSESIPTNPGMTVSIVSTTQSDGTVRATADVSSEGTCVFQYTTVDDKPVTNQVLSTNGKCSSSISEVQFAKIGTWNLKVTLYHDSKKAESEKNVTIN